jgi:hypothetical protein
LTADGMMGLAARRARALLLLALLSALPAGCDSRSPAAPSLSSDLDSEVAPGPAPQPDAEVDPPAPQPPAGREEAVFVGAGDIGRCDSGGPRKTAGLLDSIPGTVFTLGDHAYPAGSHQSFSDCYDPWWGRHKHRTKPSPGNHDYDSRGAAPYFAYFGELAGPPGLGYYSFELGSWDVYSLNSETSADRGSAQYEWLASELAGRRSPCVLAYWHEPVRSSGPNGDSRRMRAIWALLAEHRADVVLSAHDHTYERFAPQDANLQFSSTGIRQFIAGTGGAPLYRFERVQPNSEVRLTAWGVLKLTLRSDGYSWEFISVAGGVASDAGDGSCQ